MTEKRIRPNGWQAHYDRKRANGICIDCHKKAEPFARCFIHRVIKAKAVAESRKRAKLNNV